MKYFGMGRVISPKESLPATAWEIDNKKELNNKEVRIKAEIINLEITNFEQIVSSEEYDEFRIKNRILHIINERGKLHNPYTKTGGLLFGEIEEFSEDFPIGDLKKGDRVICLSPLTGIPVHIDNIESIDYDYGQIKCSGYGICFESSNIVKWDGETNIKYLLRLLDEEGNLLGIKSTFKTENISTIAVIGSNFMLTVFYAKMIREQMGNDIKIIAVMDKGREKDFADRKIYKVFSLLIDKVYFVDFNNSLTAVKEILADNGETQVDGIINTDDTDGSECIASLLVRDEGIICYMSFKNKYAEGSLIADSLGKEINSYSIYGFDKNAYSYAVTLAKAVTPYLELLDKLQSKADKGDLTIQIKKKQRTELAAQRIDDFIYSSPVTADMVEQVLNIAQYDCNVVIQGETGVGKEKVFNLIYHNSPRKGKPCVRINCATIPEGLAESEFFGYESGAFTGAEKKGKAGYFEMANNGTLFLDEIGSLSLTLQSKLLRVLQESTFYRLGGTEQLSTNVRVICANNVPLKKLVEEGRFREDLYYRLNICLIEVPALRERPEDIECLSEAFLKNYNKRYGVEKNISKSAISKMESYDWPGNVRELENVVHRLYISNQGNLIEEYDVDKILNNDLYNKTLINVKQKVHKEENMDLTELMEVQEKRIIKYALEKKGSTRSAAEFLNIPQSTLVRKKKKYNI